MSSEILVTGAAGFAGSHLVDRLVRNGADVVAWHRPGGAPAREMPRTRWEAVDLLDGDAVAAAIARVRPAAVYHCAGAAHVGRSWDSTASTFATNVRGTHHLLQALERAGAPVRVLVPSSALVYASANEALTEEHPLIPVSPYGLSKLAQEMLASGRTHAPVFIVRPFNHAGPRQSPAYVTSSFARQIAEIETGHREPVLRVGNLESRRDITDVRDTVRAYRLVVQRGQPRRPYNVCSGNAYRVRDLLDALIGLSQAPIEIRVDPSRLRPSDNPVIAGDRSRIGAEAGWTPEIPIERTLDDLLNYWRREIRA